MDRLILNCDLGEDEPIERTDELLSLVDAANISCGYHAGNFEKTATALKLAQKYGVKIGAHPGIPIDGGRGSGDIDPTEFRNLLDMQLGTFQETARSLGIRFVIALRGMSKSRHILSKVAYADFMKSFIVSGYICNPYMIHDSPRTKHAPLTHSSGKTIHFT
jgi:hypothetical protein